MRRSSSLARLLFDRVAPTLDPRVKRSVARRVTQKVALAVMDNRFMAWDPVHESAVRLADAAEALPQAEFHRLFEELCRTLMSGRVVPVQEVRRQVGEARAVYLGACMCRQSSRVQDLLVPGTNRVHLTGDPTRCLPWMERMVTAWDEVRQAPNPTHPELARILDRFHGRPLTPDDVGAFFEATFPYFEILLDHPAFETLWIGAMGKNDKLWQVDPRVLQTWVDLTWFARGNVFTSMILVDEPYTICTCPGPEADGGCLLFNWHHFSGNPYILEENPDREHGWRTDADGAPLPCARYAERANRPCYGCGCDHTTPSADAPDGLPDPRPPYTR